MGCMLNLPLLGQYNAVGLGGSGFAECAPLAIIHPGCRTVAGWCYKRLCPDFGCFLGHVQSQFFKQQLSIGQGSGDPPEVVPACVEWSCCLSVG